MIARGYSKRAIAGRLGVSVDILYKWFPSPLKARTNVAPNNIDLIREMWSEGASGTQIAAVLKCSRNAVIGVVFRARQRGEAWAETRRERDITQTKKAIRVGREKRRAVFTPVAQAARVRAPTINPNRPKREPVPVVESLNVPFLELQHFQCKAVTDDTRFAQRFCGHFRAEGSVYCAAHAALYAAPSQGKAA